MATSEEDVQAKRETVQQLREAISAERNKRSTALHQLELDAVAEQLAAEIVRLNGELDYEKAATQAQLGEVAHPVAVAPVEVALPEVPTVAKATAKADTVKEK